MGNWLGRDRPEEGPPAAHKVDARATLCLKQCCQDCRSKRIDPATTDIIALPLITPTAVSVSEVLSQSSQISVFTICDLLVAAPATAEDNSRHSSGLG